MDEKAYRRAKDLVIASNRVNPSEIQRRAGVNLYEAMAMVERMESEGLISAPTNTGKRRVLGQ